MFELHVIGLEPAQRASIKLADARPVKLGRSSQCEISVPWDRQISRVHADVVLSDGSVLIRRTKSAQNPLVFNDLDTTVIQLKPGEQFQIGQTTFRLTSTTGSTTDVLESSGFDQYTFAPAELRKVPFVQTQGRSLELLATIPKLMRDSQDDPDFAAAMVKLLLEAIPRCYAAAVVVFDGMQAFDNDDEIPEPILMRWNSRGNGEQPFRPSRRLMATAIKQAESVLHTWDQTGLEANFTNVGNLDWAFCSPILDESSRGWCLYMSGTFDSLTPSAIKEKLQEPMRFTELTAQFIGATRSVRMLQQTQTRMSSFFPPAVVRTITNENADAMLQPRTSTITVLFCDLRGFSRKMEQADTDLPPLLSRISDALSAMMRCVMEFGGVVADFQGDAALTFWGWPQETNDGPLLACRAAAAISERFHEANQDESDPLHGLSIGIGIGHGTGIAGQIGPPEQSKVGVFGAVVNQASRLQGMTKQFRTPVLIDESTAAAVRERGTDADPRCRRIARVRPRGMDTVVDVSQLLCSGGKEAELSEQQLKLHEQAFDMFLAGHWEQAQEIFQTHLPDDDGNSFHRELITGHNQCPPADWDGVVTFRS